MQLIFAIFLMVLAFSGPSYAASTGCAGLKDFKTHLEINLETPDAVYDFSKTRRQINRNQEVRHEEWLRKNNMQAIWRASEMETLGYAAGGWGLFSTLEGKAKAYDRYATYVCPYVTNISVNMMYRTIINIPKDFPEGGCTFNLILNHERRHHATNMEIVKTFAGKLRHDLPVIVREIESMQPYVPRQDLPETFENMKQAVTEALDIYLTQAIAEQMKKKNALIDSPQEYIGTGLEIEKCRGK